MARILVADDEEDVGLLVSERLRMLGHEVMWASDGDIAIKRIEEQRYDLVILDIRMPGHDGYAVCEWIKGSENHARIPVLMMSAFVQEQKTWMRSRADAFLPKPFEGEKLVSEVKRLLHLSPKA